MLNIWNCDTSEEIGERAPRFAVVPVGSFEQHGAHLPVTTDTLIAGILAKQLCERHGGLLVSPLGVTCSHEHAGFPGTLSISPRTLIAVVTDLVVAIESHGIALTVLLNGHGGNYVIGNVAQELNVIGPRVLMCPARQHWQAAMDRAGIEHSMSADMHGGELETSILLYAMPEAVRSERMQADWEAPDRPLLTLYGMRHYTTSGVIGFPSSATAEKGRVVVEEMTRILGSEIEAILARR